MGVVVCVQSPEGGSCLCASKICRQLWWSMAVVTRTCGRRSDEDVDGVLMFETDVANAADEGMILVALVVVIAMWASLLSVCGL